jgi:hypothetical protein
MLTSPFETPKSKRSSVLGKERDGYNPVVEATA